MSVGLTTLMSRTSSCPARRADLKLGLTRSSIENLTSSAVKDAPSCHLTPLRSLIVQLSPSAEIPPFATVGISAASCGVKLPSGPTPQSGLKKVRQAPSWPSLGGLSGWDAAGPRPPPTVPGRRALAGGAAQPARHPAPSAPTAAAAT